MYDIGEKRVNLLMLHPESGCQGMKITKRKWADKQPPLFFYRDSDSGKLLLQNNEMKDYTDILFNEYAPSVFERSLQNRLLKTQGKGKERQNNYYNYEIADLVKYLCRDTDITRESIKENIDKIIKKLQPQNAKELGRLKKQLDDTLSEYDKNFVAKGTEVTLYRALLNLINGRNDVQRAMAVATSYLSCPNLHKEQQNSIYDQW